MSASPYTGVILAAGHGSRMGPFGEQLPKAMAPICNKPLLAYQLDYMRQAGIEDVFIVIGHLGHRITQALGDGSAHGMRIHYVDQTKRLGIAHAVGQLEPRITRPFLLILGDIFFEIDDIRRMVREFEQHRAAAVLAVKKEEDAEAIKRNFSVDVDAQGAVRRVIEKPRRVSTALKGCGLYLFDLAVFEAIGRTPRTAMRDEYELTDSIQILIDYGYTVRAAPVVSWDMNLTFLSDVITCNAHQLAKLGRTSLVGKDCAIADGVELEETVVGDRVKIGQPTRLTRCVVLPDVTLTERRPFQNTIFTPEAILDAGEDGPEL